MNLKRGVAADIDAAPWSNAMTAIEDSFASLNHGICEIAR
jgi:hypothetical protein